MTQREEELLEEIQVLKSKLDTSSHWMRRQVQESVKSIVLSRNQRTLASTWHTISNFFHHQPTKFELWMKRGEAFLVGAAIILFWRGIWNLADHYLFPGYPDISAFTSLMIGLGILIMSKNFVNQFLDEAIEEAAEFE